MKRLRGVRKRLRGLWIRRRARAWALKTGDTWCIRPDYRHRVHLLPYDDTANKDAYQDDVYRLARDLARPHNLDRILDVGCGSGYKLRKYFEGYRCTGLEVGKTLKWLRQHYPDGDWRLSDFAQPPPEPFGLVICADVIEHLPDPDALMAFLAEIDFRYLVLSTPDRAVLVRARGHSPVGLPQNPHHLREWSFDELARYAARYVHIVEHRPAEAVGQVLVAIPKNGGRRPEHAPDISVGTYAEAS